MSNDSGELSVYACAVWPPSKFTKLHEVLKILSQDIPNSGQTTYWFHLPPNILPFTYAPLTARHTKRSKQMTLYIRWFFFFFLRRWHWRNGACTSSWQTVKRWVKKTLSLAYLRINNKAGYVSTKWKFTIKEYFK